MAHFNSSNKECFVQQLKILSQGRRAVVFIVIELFDKFLFALKNKYSDKRSDKGWMYLKVMGCPGKIIVGVNTGVMVITAMRFLAYFVITAVDRHSHSARKVGFTQSDLPHHFVLPTKMFGIGNPAVAK
jgi:hypothetical protein